MFIISASVSVRDSEAGIKGATTVEVKNCKTCGRLFNYMGGPPLCPACQKDLEDKFQEVKQYLREHPDASIHEVSEELDVSVKQLKQWVREERLSVSNAGADGITCEHCGTPIRSGRFCDKCKASMTNSLSSAIDKPKATLVQKQERSGNKMRFLQS